MPVTMMNLIALEHFKCFPDIEIIVKRTVFQCRNTRICSYGMPQIVTVMYYFLVF